MSGSLALPRPTSPRVTSCSSPRAAATGNSSVGSATGSWASGGRSWGGGSWARLSSGLIPPDSGIQRGTSVATYVVQLLQAWTTSMAATCYLDIKQTTCCWPLTTPSRCGLWRAQPYNPQALRPLGHTAQAHWSSWVRAPCHQGGMWYWHKGRQPGLTHFTHMRGIY